MFRGTDDDLAGAEEASRRAHLASKIRDEFKGVLVRPIAALTPHVAAATATRLLHPPLRRAASLRLQNLPQQQQKQDTSGQAASRGPAPASIAAAGLATQAREASARDKKSEIEAMIDSMPGECETEESAGTRGQETRACSTTLASLHCPQSLTRSGRRPTNPRCWRWRGGWRTSGAGR